MKNIKNKHLISSSQHLVSWWLTWTASKVLSNSKYKLLQVSIHWKYEKKNTALDCLHNGQTFTEVA